MSTFADTTDEAWREELELKFFSQIYPVRAFKPLLDKSDAAAILAVNSLLAYQPEPYMVATAAARAGAQSLVKSLAREFAPRIRVNSVMLGLIDSGQWQRRFDVRERTRAQTREAWIEEIARLPAHPAGAARRARRGRARHRVPVLAGGGLHHRRPARNLGRRLAVHMRTEHMTPVAAAIRQPEPAARAEPVGDLIAHALAEIGVTTVFGVISIHNMPILDAIARQGRIRFVPARSEAGAMNMADAYARVSRSLGVVHHLDRNGGRQRRGLAGRGADRRLAGAAHHLADRPAVHGPRPRRDPRRAAPGRHAARRSPRPISASGKGAPPSAWWRRRRAPR